MNDVQQVNDNLTNEIGTWLDTQKVSSGLVAPASPMMMKLTPQTARVMEKVYAKQAQKRASLRNRKPYTRKRGTVHPKRKEATARRERERRWREDPYWCLSYGYGNWRLDRELFDKYIWPLWEQHDPKYLKPKPYKGYGTKEKPYTVYTMDIVDSRTGSILFNGNSLELYILSLA